MTYVLSQEDLRFRPFQEDSVKQDTLVKETLCRSPLTKSAHLDSDNSHSSFVHEKEAPDNEGCAAPPEKTNERQSCEHPPRSEFSSGGRKGDER